MSYEEFRNFNIFLAHLDDFRLAMRMYSVASVSVSQGMFFLSITSPFFLVSHCFPYLAIIIIIIIIIDELARAIFVSSGAKLSHGMLEMIYNLFDRDDDKKLSYREFVSVIHNRLQRSLRSVASKSDLDVSKWTQWKRCVKQEVRRNI